MRKMAGRWFNMISRLALFITLFASGAVQVYAPSFSITERGERELLFMFYNVENLFDTINDEDINDDEFTPEGTRRWTISRYNRKLHSLAKVIVAAGGWYPPEMVGLCEVENQGVVEDLITRTVLSNFNYGVVHVESRDRRGIDVSFIYNRDVVNIVSYDTIEPGMGDGREEWRSRPVLYIETEVGGEIVHLFLNHWPSRRGGVLGGQRLRKLLASEIAEAAAGIREREGEDAAIVIAGDFNCSPDDEEMLILESARFVNMARDLSDIGLGTYRFRGVWQMLDQVLVSESMIGSGSPVSAISFDIFSPDFLLYDDPSFPGRKPFASYEGFTYIGGYSDHLPVLLSIGLRRVAPAD